MSERTGSRPEAYGHAPFLRPLAALSARMGRDLTQVQGPGGNTSLKHGGVLWVKASGTDLADADRSCIFAPVDLEAALAAIGAEEECPVPLHDIPQAEGMRASIEVSLHALMPQRTVLHTHDVNVIAWACRADAEQALAGPLDGLNWAFVPYARPGLELTRRVRGILDQRTPDILILGNHGLVAGADTPEAAAQHVAAVRERLALEPRPVPAADTARLARLAQGTDFAPAGLPDAHWTALDGTALRVTSGGVLYPDHVVFLGAEVAVIPPEAPERLQETEAALAAVPGAGVLLRKGACRAAQAMAACLGLVASRFPDDARPRYLDFADIPALLGWDAERYRQEQARRRAAAMQG
ncbi:MAG: class II aldolase/adducin family protein [Alphaproteobacteria bacterium]